MAIRIRAMKFSAGAIAAVCLCCSLGRANDCVRVAALFEGLFETAPGQSIYVLGDIAELGGNDATRAVKLEPGAYPTWRAWVAIPAGTTFTYRFVRRADSVSQWSNPANITFLTPAITDEIAPDPGLPPHKGVFYHSGWAQPRVFWRISGSSTPFNEREMDRFGPGRGPGEFRWRAILPHFGGEEIQFYFTDGASGRDPGIGVYITKLDAFFLQEGQLYSYVPPATVSSPQQTNFSGFLSTALGEIRPYRVLLPRGYSENTSRRYPVVYFHDGQNVFDIGPFGSWNADETANNLIRNARMAEAIFVAIDNTANRARDYIPPDDIVPIGPGTGQPGRANLYAQFLINELKPVIDANYRTQADREHTFTIGSSLGGVVSLYLGWDFHSVFGGCGPMSGSWQLPNFPNRVGAEPFRELRTYLDSGDSGPSNDNAWLTMNLRDVLLRKGYALEGDLRHRVGYGQQHNEAAWAARLPFALEFLLRACSAPNELVPDVFAGDMNCDGSVSVGDIGGFVLAITNPPAYMIQFPGCDIRHADINGDGIESVGDIGAFVALVARP